MKNTRFCRWSLLLAGVLGASGTVSAATVVEYGFDSGLTASSVLPGVTASPLKAVGVDFVGAASISGFLQNPVGRFTQWTGATADALEFTLTPPSGHGLDLDYLSFVANSEWVDFGNRAPLVWRIEVFGGAAGLLSFDLNIPAYDAWVMPVIDLSGLTFAPGETFRARIEGLGANNDDRKVDFDSILVAGRLVPEPGALALVAGLGLVVFGAFRRTRQVR